jgi:hypothetical protein
VDFVAGFEKAPESLGFKEGMRFYYFQGLARTLPLLPEGIAKQRRTGLIKVLLELQQKDGSWQNDSARMREDDPLIATCFALIALGRLQE